MLRCDFEQRQAGMMNSKGHQRHEDQGGDIPAPAWYALVAAVIALACVELYTANWTDAIAIWPG